MMTFEEFVERVKEELIYLMPDSYIVDGEVDVVDVLKTNDTHLSGLIVKSSAVNISPTVYLEPFYEEYTHASSFSNILVKISDIIQQNMPTENMDVQKFLKWDDVKNMVISRMCSIERNKEFLSDKPYTKMEDMAVTYCLLISDRSESGQATVAITNEMMKEYGIGLNILHERAMINNEVLQPVNIMSLSDVMLKMMGTFDDPADMDNPGGMLILSNVNGLYGSVNILNPDIMDRIAERIGQEFYILPSSVHEVLIYPKDEFIDYQELEEMVNEVNETQVAPEEVLSNHVYEVDFKRHELIRADREKVIEKKIEKAAKKIEPKKPRL